MLVVMKAQATPEEIQAVCDHIEQLGFRAHPLPGAQRTAIGITGNQGEVDRGNLEALSGVAEVIRVSKAYKLASRDVKEEDTVIRFPGIGTIPKLPSAAAIWPSSPGRARSKAANRPSPSPNRLPHQARSSSVAELSSRAPRPYAFQGLGLEALRIMAEIRDRFGLRIVTEAIDNESLEMAAEWADVIQIGARNMQNFSLLKRAGRLRKPILLKRGLSATLEEFLMSAEYIMSEGNYQVILCERGVRTFTDHSRNTLDLSIVPAVQRAEPPAYSGRSQPRHRTARQRAADGASCHCDRRRWTDDRSPSSAGKGALRRSAVHLSRHSLSP